MKNNAKFRVLLLGWEAKVNRCNDSHISKSHNNLHIKNLFLNVSESKKNT